MKTIMQAALMAALIGAGAAASAAAAPQNDQQQIRAQEDRFAAAFRAKDATKIMSVYAPGDRLLVFDAVPPRQYVGAAAYQKDWSELFAGFKGPIKVEISDLGIETAGAFAWSHSIQHVSGMGVGGKPTDITVRVTDIWRKTPAGWRIVHEHVSFPVDLATGRADLASKP